MDFSFSEEQEELRRSARSFLADFSSAEQVRQTMAVEPGFDAVVWRRIAKELGWASIIVPEQYGGIGWGAVVPDPQFADRAIELGCRMPTMGNDVHAMRRGIDTLKDAFANQF